MATYKSTNITNFENDPIIKTPVGNQGGRVRSANGFVTLGSAIATADVIHLCPIPTNARILEIRIRNDNFGTDAPCTLGLYTTAGVAVDADAYHLDVTLETADETGTDWSIDAGARNLPEFGQEVWQDGAQTTDPGGLYYISLTVGTVVSGSAGDLTFDVRYTVD